MDSAKWKFLPPALVAAGSAAVLYGMLKEDDIVFLAGLPLLVLGYLMIRKKLKERIR